MYMIFSKTLRLTKLFILMTIFVLSLSCLSVRAEAIEEPSIQAQTAILIDADTEEILYTKNEGLRWYPASTTKIMVALLTLEKGNYTDTVTLSSSALNTLQDLYCSLYLSVGNRLTIDQLLHALLIVSDNGAANALAEYVDGSQANFVAHMNRKAAELGCTGTHFSNTYGHTDDEHYVTAHDLYRIAREAMKYPLFREIVHSDGYQLQAPGVDVWLHTCNQIVDTHSSNYDPRALGIKTGYTRAAQCNLVVLATEKNHRLYSVVMGSPRTGYGDQSYPDTQKLLSYGFSKLEEKRLALEKEKQEKLAAEAIEAAKVKLEKPQAKTARKNVKKKG